MVAIGRKNGQILFVALASENASGLNAVPLNTKDFSFDKYKEDQYGELNYQESLFFQSFFVSEQIKIQKSDLTPQEKENARAYLTKYALSELEERLISNMILFQFEPVAVDFTEEQESEMLISDIVVN